MWRSNFDEDVIPISEFGKDVFGHADKLGDTGRPMLLTKGGRCVAVAMSAKLYDALVKKCDEVSAASGPNQTNRSLGARSRVSKSIYDGLSPMQKILHACVLCGMTKDVGVHRHQLIYAINFVMLQRQSEQSIQRLLEDAFIDGYLIQKEGKPGWYFLSSYGTDSFSPVHGFDNAKRLPPAEVPRFELAGYVAGTKVVISRVSRSRCVTVIDGVRHLQSKRAMKKLSELDRTIEMKENRSQAAELFNLAVERDFSGTWTAS